MKTSFRTNYQYLVVLVCALGMAYIYTQILQHAGGSLFFSLDDPYIHLSLAENLLQGHYGINPGETASPSSSIVYPFLLTLTSLLGMGSYGALFWNVLGALGTAWILGGLLWDAFAHDNRIPPVVWLLAPVMLVAVNGFALAFTGMEHTLHVFVSLVILRGLAQGGRDHAPSAWMILALIAAPLLRFEGFALSGGAILALLYWRHWRAALIAGLSIIAIVALYIVAMRSLGLPPLPSSVMMKSEVSAATIDRSFAASILQALGEIPAATFHTRGLIIWGGLVLSGIALIHPENRSKRVFFVVVAMAALGHMVAGKWDWFDRYEIYVLCFTLASVLVLWRPILSAHNAASAKHIATLAGLITVAMVYLPALILTPSAAQNIHDQQYQMHRFSTEYFPETVAVNDLGWPSYQNETYVLDLWGLGSETARKHWAQVGLQTGWVRDLMREHNAVYAMLYPSMFEAALDPSWCKMAELKTIRISSYEGRVGFYLIDQTQAQNMRAALTAFAPTLPNTASLTTFDCP